MLYENTAKVRKLVAVRRVKKWVRPGGIVDLDSTDIRMLGRNGAFFSPVGSAKSTNKKQAPAATKAQPAEKPVAKKEPKKQDNKKVDKKDKPAPKKKEDKKAKKDIDKKAKESAARKELQKAFSDKTKAQLIEFGEGVLGYDVRSNDRKDVIIKKLLKVSKDIGYSKVLKKL